jgi:hypothetical protein
MFKLRSKMLNRLTVADVIGDRIDGTRLNHPTEHSSGTTQTASGGGFSRCDIAIPYVRYEYNIYAVKVSLLGTELLAWG